MDALRVGQQETSRIVGHFTIVGDEQIDWLLYYNRLIYIGANIRPIDVITESQRLSDEILAVYGPQNRVTTAKSANCSMDSIRDR